jgi:L-2-hydroxyglutarate oxidase LhgO
MSRLELDAVVIGGGVVGVSVARALALRGRDVHLLEGEAQLGTHTSARNSEVIHAGLYYPSDSLKARLCVEGREALYAFCARHGVAFRRVQKLVVACDDADLTRLGALAAQARRNGVEVQETDAREARRLEPAVRCVAALLSPTTGIVDSHGLVQALAREARAHGATLVMRAKVVGGRAARDGVELTVGNERVLARTVVNCAGLFAQRVAHAIQGIDRTTIPANHYARGHYYYLRGASPFTRLVYPLPDAHGLGIHVTLDLQGRARFGPDVQFSEALDYRFDAARRGAFERAIRRYFALPDDALTAGYVGIRPKLGPEGSAAGDFVIDGEAVHGVRGLVNLYGIESPGLTACLAIAEHVASRLDVDL